MGREGKSCKPRVCSLMVGPATEIAICQGVVGDIEVMKVLCPTLASQPDPALHH